MLTVELSVSWRGIQVHSPLKLMRTCPAKGVSTRFLEKNLRRLSSAVLLSEMAISLHRQRAAVRVAEPSRDRRNIDAGLDAAGREKMPEIIVVDRFQTDARAGHCLMEPQLRSTSI